MTLKVAIVGSGPAGFYTAEALTKSRPDIQIDIIDRLPTPFGLIRAGVAPDHQSVKTVTRRYEDALTQADVAFFGNIEIGDAISMATLRALYHAVVIATGAPADRGLGIPGEDLPGVIGAARFVSWYNGHPDHADLNPDLNTQQVVVIGNGNVALDVARVLAKTPSEMTQSDLAKHAAARIHAAPIRDIIIAGRRGPHQASFTPKELGEMGHLAQAVPLVMSRDLPDPSEDAALESGLRKAVSSLRQFATRQRDEKPIGVHFHFFIRPFSIMGDKKVEAIRMMKTRLEGDHAVDTGDTIDIPCGLVVPCVGYRSRRIDGVPFDHERGRFTNENGFIEPGLYCVGWARRGPTGTIGTNKPDGFMLADTLLNTAPTGAREGRAGLERLIAEQDLYAVRFEGWKRIEAAETARANPGAPREKFVTIAEMLAAEKSS